MLSICALGVNKTNVKNNAEVIVDESTVEPEETVKVFPIGGSMYVSDDYQELCFSDGIKREEKVEIKKELPSPVEKDDTQNDEPIRFVMGLDDIKAKDYKYYYPSYYDVRDGAYHDIMLPYDLQCFVQECCEKYNVPFNIMMGIFGHETGWNYKKYGLTDNGYCGIGMLHVEYNRKYLLETIGVDILTTKGSIEGAVYVFSKKLRRFNEDVTMAIIAYNKGDNGAIAVRAKGETQTGYSKRVYEIVNGLVEERCN